MKQHITPKQLNELSEKGKERLRKWWLPKEGDWYVWYPKDKKVKPNKEEYLLRRDVLTPMELDFNAAGLWGMGMWDEIDEEEAEKFFQHKKLGYLPLLSIGQMIEFLGEHDEVELGLVLQDLVIEAGPAGEMWIKSVDYQDFCDALWVERRCI